MSFKINTTVAAGSPLPPALLNTLSRKSHEAVERWRRGHRPDGTHDDEIVPHAFGMLIHAGAGVYNVSGAIGLLNHVMVATGIVEITLQNPMDAAETWILAAWAHHRVSLAPLRAYPTPLAIGGVGNVKTIDSCDVRIAEWNTGTLVNHSFTFAAFGVREL